MTTRAQWQCYSWQGPESERGAKPDQEWTSPEGAVEFLRRELSAHGLYSKDVLVGALRELREGGSVSISNELSGGGRLNLEVNPVHR